MGGGGHKSKAGPHAQIKATVNNRNAGTNASKQDNVIWDNEDIKDHVEDKRENRPKPVYEVINASTLILSLLLFEI